MDEKKEIKSKKINIKNKKMAAQVLSKTKTKKTSSTKKTSNKIQNTKIKDLEIKDIDVIKNEPNIELVTGQEEKKPKKTRSTAPKKATKEGTTEKKKVAKKVTDKKEEKKTTKRKTTKKGEPKTKLEIPKEWQAISKNTRKSREEEQEKTITTKLKRSIFEELDEREFKEKKAKEKAQFKKTVISILIFIAVIVVAVFLLMKYNDFVKSKFTAYDTYNIGDLVTLEDGSKWYVIENSGEKSDSVTLLKDNLLDVNKDGAVNEYDTLMYNTDNKSDYDIENENSVAYYLEYVYKPELEAAIGKVEEIRLLTSKEYIRARDKMEFGYEWTTTNWLAGLYLNYYWIVSSQNNKVYYVNGYGSYILCSPNKLRLIRPVITIKKELVKEVEPIQKEDKTTEAVKKITIFKENES